jgi:preprotein translocase subunit SecG
MLKIILYAVQLIVCLILIGSVLLQPGKSAGLSGSIAGGAEQLFGKKKSKGYEAVAAKATTASAILFMVISMVLLVVQ